MKLIFADIRKSLGGAEIYFDYLYNDVSDLVNKKSWSLEKLIFNESDPFFSKIKSILAIKNTNVILNTPVLGVNIFWLTLLFIRNNVYLFPHIVVDHYTLKSKLPFFRNIFNRVSLRLAKGVFVISKGNFKVLKKLNPNVKYIYFPNYPRVLVSNDTNLDYRKFAVIGRFQERHKGQLNFLRKSFAKIKRNKFKILFFGSGEDEHYVRDFVEKNKLEKFVFFMGKLSVEDIFKYNFGHVISCSNWEGLPLNLLEAYYHNRIVWGVPVLGVEELIHHRFHINDYTEPFNNVNANMLYLYNSNREYVINNYNKTNTLNLFTIFLENL